VEAYCQVLALLSTSLEIWPVFTGTRDNWEYRRNPPVITKMNPRRFSRSLPPPGIIILTPRMTISGKRYRAMIK
jgi:hypothetical protein